MTGEVHGVQRELYVHKGEISLFLFMLQRIIVAALVMHTQNVHCKNTQNGNCVTTCCASSQREKHSHFHREQHWQLEMHYVSYTMEPSSPSAILSIILSYFFHFIEIQKLQKSLAVYIHNLLGQQFI